LSLRTIDFSVAVWHSEGNFRQEAKNINLNLPSLPPRTKSNLLRCV